MVVLVEVGVVVGGDGWDGGGGGGVAHSILQTLTVFQNKTSIKTKTL